MEELSKDPLQDVSESKFDFSVPFVSADTCRGRWEPDTQRVLLEKTAGKIVHTMGVMEGKDVFLNVEEALYLLERGSMTIHHSQSPLSVHLMHHLMTTAGVPTSVYVVYSHLKDLGFAVLRHRPREPPVHHDATSQPTTSTAIFAPQDPQTVFSQSWWPKLDSWIRGGESLSAFGFTQTAKRAKQKFSCVAEMRASLLGTVKQYKEEQQHSKTPNVRIWFDVIKPGLRKSRKVEIAPLFCVAIVSQADACVGLSALLSTQAEASSVPVVFAAVENGVVLFLNLESFL